MMSSGPVRDGTGHGDLAHADSAREKSASTETALLKLENFLPHRLNVLSSLVSQALTRVYGQHGIGIPEWRVLVSLGQFGIMTGKAIGSRTHMHKTKVSRAVAQLERRKYLVRRTNRSDLREAFLSLTPAGRAIYDELAPRALEFTARLSEVVTSDDRAAFDRAVQQLTERSAKLVADMDKKALDTKDLDTKDLDTKDLDKKVVS